jgi:membrane protease YdiL (CAAX protease family)
MKARTWWLVLIAAGIGAPIAEECLFRGLMFGTLRRTSLGIGGAAAVSAILWALLHANYSIYGVTAITLIGIYLALVRERTGSLLTPIVCHGAYNSLIVLVLAFAPNSSLVTG